jgi:hypothetical protein
LAPDKPFRASEVAVGFRLLSRRVVG